MTGNTQHSRRRRGYTLMEMLLVQGVIVALVAMSWPALRGSLDKNRLLAAARQVRTDLVQARLKAAETGIPQQFRYQPGLRSYEVAPTDHAMTAAATDAGRPGTRNAAAAGGVDEDFAGGEFEEARVTMLDEQIRFAHAADLETSAARIEGDESLTAEDLAPAAGPAGEDWSAPVVFLPNGRSSNARIRLVGARGSQVDGMLRGVTGAVTIGDLTKDEDSE